jgi:predicted ferric reductase
MQRREMKVVDVVYNIHRYLSYFAVALLGFLQSPEK